MELTFRHISGKSYKINEIDPQSTVGNVKNILSNICGIKASNIEFTHNSRRIQDSEMIGNIIMTHDSFILFYESIPESELNTVSDNISSFPQLCHKKGAPPLSSPNIIQSKISSLDTRKMRSPDFFADQELQILTPYLNEPIISQIHTKPDIYSFVDPELNRSFSKEFKVKEVPIEAMYSKNFVELLKPNYPIVEVSEKIINCVDQEIKMFNNNTDSIQKVQPSINPSNLNASPPLNSANPNLNRGSPPNLNGAPAPSYFALYPNMAMAGKIFYPSQKT